MTWRVVLWLVVIALSPRGFPAVLENGEMYCSCRFWHQRNITFALHCSDKQDLDKDFSCKKASVADVPPGYEHVPGYALVRLSRVFQPWPAARWTCESEGSRLAFPTDRRAVDGLRRMLAQHKSLWYAFVGISDESSEGVFVGVDGRPAPYLNWQPGEPNDHQGKENCVTVRKDGLMNDLPCRWPAPFFCERPLRVRVPEAYRWQDAAGRFYRVHEERRTHAQAAQVCRSENGTLAVADTWQRLEALLRLLEATTDYYFVGLTDHDVEGDFVTETGRHLSDMEFQVWGPKEDTYSGTGQEADCLALSGQGYYRDVRCEQQLPFICEVVPVG